GGNISQCMDDRDIAAQCCWLLAGIGLEARLQEEGFRCKAQNETTIWESGHEPVSDLSEGQDRISDSRARWIPEVIVAGIPKNGLPYTASFIINVDAIKPESCNQVKHRIDEGIPVRIGIELEGSAGGAAD